MLVLSRRPGESILIGDDVIVTVQDVRGDRVSISIKAPRSLNIARAEIAFRTQNEESEED